MNRKEFIKTGGRILLLGGFAIFSGYLFVTKRISKTKVCPINDNCSNCNKFTACELPQATKTKTDGEES